MKFKQWHTDDPIPENMGRFHSQVAGKIWLVPDKSCFACDYCTDVWLDWNGPYGVMCNIDKDVNDAINTNNCPYFKNNLSPEEIKNAKQAIGKMTFIDCDENDTNNY